MPNQPSDHQQKHEDIAWQIKVFALQSYTFRLRQRRHRRIVCIVACKRCYSGRARCYETTLWTQNFAFDSRTYHSCEVYEAAQDPSAKVDNDQAEQKLPNKILPVFHDIAPLFCLSIKQIFLWRFCEIQIESNIELKTKRPRV